MMHERRRERDDAGGIGAGLRQCLQDDLLFHGAADQSVGETGEPLRAGGGETSLDANAVLSAAVGPCGQLLDGSLGQWLGGDPAYEHAADAAFDDVRCPGFRVVPCGQLTDQANGRNRAVPQRRGGDQSAMRVVAREFVQQRVDRQRVGPEGRDRERGEFHEVRGRASGGGGGANAIHGAFGLQRRQRCDRVEAHFTAPAVEAPGDGFDARRADVLDHDERDHHRQNGRAVAFGEARQQQLGAVARGRSQFADAFRERGAADGGEVAEAAAQRRRERRGIGPELDEHRARRPQTGLRQQGLQVPAQRRRQRLAEEFVEQRHASGRLTGRTQQGEPARRRRDAAADQAGEQLRRAFPRPSVLVLDRSVEGFDGRRVPIRGAELIEDAEAVARPRQCRQQCCAQAAGIELAQRVQGRRHGAQRMDSEQLRQDLPAEFGGALELPDRSGAQIGAGEFGPKLGGVEWSSLAHVHQHGGRGARRVGFALVAHGFERGQGRGSGFRMRHQPDHRFVAQVGVRPLQQVDDGLHHLGTRGRRQVRQGGARRARVASQPRAQMLLGVAATAHQQARRQRREPDPPPVPLRLRHHDRHYERTVVGREVPRHRSGWHGGHGRVRADASAGPRRGRARDVP